MPLTPEQQQELQDLKRMDELEKQLGHNQSPNPVEDIAKLGNPPGYQPSQEDLSRYQNAAMAGATSGPVGTAIGEGLGRIISPVTTPLGSLLRKGGDVLMQRAVGSSKAIPGLGEKYAEQGLIGTKGMMAGQAERGLEASGKRIGELASQIPGSVSQDQVANNIAELANKKMTPSGFVRPEDEPTVNRLLSKAQDFGTAEPISGSEMAARRATAGNAAREAGAYKMNPSSQMKSKVASAEQAGYSEALKKAYAEAFPGAPEALADADKQYSVLSTAASHLNKPESAGGLKSFLGQFVPTSLIESTAGRASIGGGKTLQSIPTGASKLTLQNLLKPNSYSHEDR